jgi:hypothetical protein
MQAEPLFLFLSQILCSFESTRCAVQQYTWAVNKACITLVLVLCAVLQGYTTYAAVVYVMAGIIGGCLLACGWVAFKFNKNGVVPNKW